MSLNYKIRAKIEELGPHRASAESWHYRFPLTTAWPSYPSPLGTVGGACSFSLGYERLLERSIHQQPLLVPSYQSDLLPIAWKTTWNGSKNQKRKERGWSGGNPASKNLLRMPTEAWNFLQAMLSMAKESTLGTMTIKVTRH